MLINTGAGPRAERWTKFAKMTPEQFIAFQVLYNEMLEQVHGKDHNQLRWYVPNDRLQKETATSQAATRTTTTLAGKATRTVLAAIV